MALSSEERILIEEHYDIYDLIEILGITAEEIIDIFDLRIEDNEEIMLTIGS